MGNNHSRNAFTFSPWTSIPGRWLQYVFKKTVTNSIKFFHTQIIKHYDKEAYLIDDPRLQRDKEYLKEFCKEWMELRKQDIFNDASDIFFFMLKEDAFYRRLYIVLRNKLIMEGHIYGLDAIEQEELLKWKGK